MYGRPNVSFVSMSILEVLDCSKTFLGTVPVLTNCCTAEDDVYVPEIKNWK